MANTQSGRQNSNVTTDNITLRIIILAHGERSEDDLFLVLSLDTTVAQLKLRIQESLPQHPTPDTQRLIYHGRPLIESNASLRQTLRIDQRSANPSHVIHLVISDRQHERPQPHENLPNPVPNVPDARPVPPETHPPLALPLDDDAHMAIHERLHNMQHNIEHQQALRAHHAMMHQNDHAVHNPTQQLPQIHRPVPQFNHPGQHVHPRVTHPTVTATRIQERIGPNGEHIRTVVDNNGSTSTTMMFRLPGRNQPNPNERPSSAPGTAAQPAGTPPVRAAVPVPHQSLPPAPPPQIPLPQLPAGLPLPPGIQLPMLPFPPPFHAQPQPQPANHATVPPASPSRATAWLVSSARGPQAVVFAPGHGFFSTLPSTNTAQMPSTSDMPRPTPTVPVDVTGEERPQAQLVIRPQDGHAEVRGLDPAPPQPGAVPLAPQPAAARPVQRNLDARLQDNDIVQLFVSRGWLFLRLYMFIFVLSESGTWRRFIMLTCAIFICLVPRTGRVTDLVNIARRHFDNLIGPPNIPQRQPEQQRDTQAGNQMEGRGDTTNPETVAPSNVQAQQDNSTTSSTSTNRQRAAMPTPEEAARRLLEQQNRRNPNPVVDLFYRIEQGIALFLASLIPGLGERHVQAREQARRILDEEERRAREEREAREQQSVTSVNPDSSLAADDKRDAGPLPESWSSPSADSDAAGASSGVNTRPDQAQDGVRLRTHDG